AESDFEGSGRDRQVQRQALKSEFRRARSGSRCGPGKGAPCNFHCNAGTVERSAREVRTLSSPKTALRASRAARFPFEEFPHLLRGPGPVAARELDTDGGHELAGIPRQRVGASAWSDCGSPAAARTVSI